MSLDLIGIGDDGPRGLSAALLKKIDEAEILGGGERHQGLFEKFQGERVVLKSGLAEALTGLVKRSQKKSVVLLASGDPLFYGIGKMLMEKAGDVVVNIYPHPSAMQLAFARAGLAWQAADTFSVHGRSMEGVAARLAKTALAGIYTDEVNSPQAIAARLLDVGDTDWQAWICENLEGEGEKVSLMTLRALAGATGISPLNTLLLQRTLPDWKSPAILPYLAEEAFAKKVPKIGLITKREVRVLSLAAMRLRTDSVVWDIGAGSGSVAVEAAKMACRGRVFAVEVDEVCQECIEENFKFHGVDHAHLVKGLAPQALRGLPRPDAVFVGGSKGSLAAIVDQVLAVLAPGGWLVINAVTFENVGEAYAVLKERKLNSEISMVQISRGAPLATYHRYEALNPIHIFAVQKTDIPVETK